MKFKNEVLHKDHPFSIGLIELSHRDLPIKTSYSIAKLLNELESPHKVYITAQKQLVEKYGEDDGDGKYNIKKVTDQIEKEFDELNSIEFEISFKEKIKLPEDIEIKPKTLAALSMVVEV